MAAGAPASGAARALASGQVVRVRALVFGAALAQ